MRRVLCPVWRNNDVEFILTGLWCWLCAQAAVSDFCLISFTDHTTTTYNQQLSPPASQSLLTSVSSATAWHTHTQAVIVKPHKMPFLALLLLWTEQQWGLPQLVNAWLLKLLVDRRDLFCVDHSCYAIPVELWTLNLYEL